ncbi:hypothetical protein [Rickettsia massiliae]|uniref:hypothetical protein n=1 Tax=Rickettsia massiliae TaxID=35791 RepID=UPI001EE404CA|nr:hypothetical protein [Rickettsia massiliae]
MNKIKLIIIYLLWINMTVQADNISERKNLAVINSLNVEEKWQKGNVINCKLGETLLEETAKYNSPKLKSV